MNRLFSCCIHILRFTILLIVLVSCQSEDEYHYEEALRILNNTTYGGLSNVLSHKALTHINKAIEINTNNSKYYRVKGSAHISLKEFIKAEASLKKSIELNQKNYLAWLNLAIVKENTGDFQKAEDYYFHALKDKSLSKLIYTNLGLLYSKWEKYKTSVKYFTRVIDIDESTRIGYSGRANANLLLKEYRLSIVDCNLLIDRDPTDKLALNTRGLARQGLNLHQEAVVDFKQSLATIQNDSFNENYDVDVYALNNIGNSYFALNEIDKACEHWNKAIENGYQYDQKWKIDYGIENPETLIERYCATNRQKNYRKPKHL